MTARLRYRYGVGEAFRYRLTVNLLVEEPGAPAQGGRGVLESVHEVHQEHDDGTWTVELRSQTVELDGILQGQLPAFLMDRVAVIRMDAEGTLLDLDGEAAPARIPAFPTEDLEEGASWVVPDVSSPVPIQMTYMLQSLEPVEGDLVAHVVSSGSTDPGEDGGVTHVDSLLAFSVEGGCVLGSTTVIETDWPEGRKVSLVLENELVERGTYHLPGMGEVEV